MKVPVQEIHSEWLALLRSTFPDHSLVLGLPVTLGQSAQNFGPPAHLEFAIHGEAGALWRTASYPSDPIGSKAVYLLLLASTSHPRLLQEFASRCEGLLSRNGFQRWDSNLAGANEALRGRSQSGKALWISARLEEQNEKETLFNLGLLVIQAR